MAIRANIISTIVDKTKYRVSESTAIRANIISTIVDNGNNGNLNKAIRANIISTIVDQK